METKTYTLADLQQMPGGIHGAQARALIRKAVEMKGTAVVRRADGTIKYDDPAQAGTYHEDAIDERRS